MKIAIFFSGRVKGFEDIMPLLRNIEKQHEITYFAALNLRSADPEYHDLFKEILNIHDAHFHNLIFYEDPDKLVQYSKNKANETNLDNACSMFYHWKKNMEMIEKSGNHYDLVLSLRADLLPSNMESFPFSPCSDNTVCIPEGNDWCGVNDQVAFGTMTSMKLYCTLYDNLPEYTKYIRFHPETLLNYHLKHVGLNNVRFTWDYSLNNRKNLVYAHEYKDIERLSKLK